MSDTPIAEQLAAALDMPWPLRETWSINGHLFERVRPMADPNCSRCGGTGWRDGSLSEQVAHGEVGAQVPCGC